MPRGAPKRVVTFRIDPELLDEIHAYDVVLTEAVEEGMRLWLRRAKRVPPKASPQPPRKPARGRPKA
jgi:hypothetical protein